MNQLPFEFDQNPLRREFEVYHAENPGVYIWLGEAALGLLGRGREHYGIRALIEAFRFHTVMETTDPDFKINDHHAPFYSRLLMENHPELAGFFETRRAAADEG